jgi:hypothetical protein
MAGSWGHMTTDKVKFRNVETFHQMLENGGDVYEAAEECFGMVWYLAESLSVIGGNGSRQDMLEWIALAEDHYRDGLRLGGVQKER